MPTRKLGVKIDRMYKIIFLPVALLSASVSLAEVVPDSSWRLPSVEQVTGIFEVAKRRPERSEFSAVIKTTGTPLSPEEIAVWRRRYEEAAAQEGGKRVSDLGEENEKEIARLASGSDVFYIKEWYSRNYIRTDRYNSEELLEKETDRSRMRRYVELYDLGFSKYLHYEASIGLRRATLSRDIAARRARNYLWAAFGMDPEFVALVLDAVSVLSPEEIAVLARENFSGLSLVRLDPEKVQQLSLDKHPRWTIRVSPDGKTYSFKGNWHIGSSSYDVGSFIQLSAVLDNVVFVSGSISNKTESSSLDVLRSGVVGVGGIPRVWVRTARDDKNKKVKETSVSILYGRQNIEKTDRDIFGPPAPGPTQKFVLTEEVGRIKKIIHVPADMKVRAAQSGSGIETDNVIRMAACMLILLVTLFAFLIYIKFSPRENLS
jgi:hypothetical protein